MPPENSSNFAEVTLLADTLHRLNRLNLLTAKQIEDILGLAERSAYAYYGATDLRFNQFRTLFRQCRSTDVQRELLGVFAAGTGWVFEHIDADRDINGDGVIDTADLFHGAIQANAALAGLMQSALNEARAGQRTMSARRADEVRSFINTTITRLLEVRQAVDFLSQDRTRRTA